MKIKAYHGTSTKFEEFEEAKSGGVNFGPGLYFTENSAEAATYVHGQRGYVLTVELTISNPFDVRNKQHGKMLAHELGLSWSSVTNNSGHMNPDGGLTEEDRDVVYHQVISELFDNGVGRNYHIIKGDVKELMAELGFDGIYDPKRKWWVAFRSSQVQIIESKTIRQKW